MRSRLRLRLRLKRAVMAAAVLTVAAGAWAQSSFPVPDAADFPGAMITGTRSFTRESLYGYIDGGAELYLEYGFDTLVVTEIASSAKDIKTEVYRMKDAEAAFGIFSVSRYRCNGGPRLTQYCCRSAFQLQFCKGPYYVSIINTSGTPEEQALSNSIALKLLERINNDSFNPEAFFPEGVSDEAMASAVLVRGRLGIYNGIPALTEILGDAAGYTALIIKEGGETIISAKFDTEESVKAFVDAQKIDTEVLRRGESSPAVSGAYASMICVQHLLISVK